MKSKSSGHQGSCVVPIAAALISALATIFVALITNPTILDRLLPSNPPIIAPASNVDQIFAPTPAPAVVEPEVIEPEVIEPEVIEPEVIEPAVADQCIVGYAWREAVADDHVCVTVEMRQQVAEDNALAESRKDPAGAYGPDSCISGYVWRVAIPADLVCVTVEMRQQVADDNALAAERVER